MDVGREQRLPPFFDLMEEAFDAFQRLQRSEGAHSQRQYGCNVFDPGQVIPCHAELLLGGE